MATTEEIRAALSACFAANAELLVSSATFFRWADHPDDPDAHLLIVIDELPAQESARRLHRSLCADELPPLGVTWVSLASAQAGLRRVGNPLTELAVAGFPVAGTPITNLVPDAAPYDHAAVRAEGHEMSRRWVARLRDRLEVCSTGSHLALVLEGSADAALMHHRLGRLASTTDGRPTEFGERRLGRLIGATEARVVVETILSLDAQGETDCSGSLDTIRSLVDAMLAAAADPAAQGCTIG